ncbi:hypothetical protein LP420_16115 [Massilia sp. B-10]|nr:hypothetical protein LP420_16115 [Massilia sp. B-10]
MLASWYKPWHMAHDVIAKVSKAASIEAKFDYDAVLHKDLEGEKVHAYLYGTGMTQWQYLGSYQTNSDGKISVPLGARGGRLRGALCRRGRPQLDLGLCERGRSGARRGPVRHRRHAHHQ